MTEEAQRTYADLRIQAMLLDLAVDWETLDLVPKSDYRAPQWLTAWKNKQEEADFDERMDIDR